MLGTEQWFQQQAEARSSSSLCNAAGITAIRDRTSRSRKIGRPRKPGEASPAPFDPPEAADEIQRETGFGDLQR